MRKQWSFCIATTTTTLLFLLEVPWASALCYYPNGKPSDDLACDPTAEVSVCCNRGAACLSNGVCEHLPDSSAGVAATYGRGSCTDQSWQSASCPQFCQTTFLGGGVPVSNCTTDGDWCCGADDGSCCEGKVVKLGAGNLETTLGLVAAASTSTARRSSSASSSSLQRTATSAVAASTGTAGRSSASSSWSLQGTATSVERTRPTASPAGIVATTSSPAATAAPTSTHSADDTAIKVGAGVGSALGLLLVGTLAYTAFLHRKRARDKRDALQRQAFEGDRKGSFERQQPRTPVVSAHELYWPTMYEGSELPGAREPAELGGHGRAQLSDVVVK